MDTRLRVLLVDNSPDDAFLLLHELRRGNYDPAWQRVDTADAMKEALNNKTWDIVLSDYSMPGFNGLKALSILRESGLDLPFILVSDAVGEEMAVMVMKAGAHDYVMKNNLSRLVPAVERELQEAELRRERKKAEEELKLRAELLNAATDSITLREFNDNVAGKPIYANKAAYETRGYTREEFLKMDIQDYTMPEDVASIKQRFELLRERGEATTEATQRRKDGSPMDVEIHARILTLDDKTYVLSVSRDITQRKKRQEELRASEAKFRNLVDNAPVGIGLTTFDGRVIFRNKAFSEFSGYSADELLNVSPVTRYYDPKDRERFIELIKKGLVRDYETRMRRKDGSIYWASFAGIPQQTEFGDGYLTVAQDITQRKLAEEALKENEQRLREAQALGEIGNWEFDLATQKIEWSDEVYKLYERDKALDPPSPEEEAGYYTPEEGRRLRDFARTAIEKGEKFSYDFAANLPRGKTVFFHGTMNPVKDEKGGVIKLFGTVQNITERKKAEEALRESEAKYSTLVEKSNDGILVIENGILRFANTKIAEMTGFAPDEVLGRKFVDFSPPDERAPLMERHLKRLSGENVPVSYEATIVAQDGHRIPVEVNASLITYQERPAVMAIIHDITERKKAEEALKASEEKFRNLVENTPVGIGLSTFDGHALFRNKALFEMSGFTNEELIGTPVASRYANPKDWERLVQMAKKGPVRDFEVRMKHKNGSLYWASYTAIPQKTESGDGYLSISQDITKRKLTEEALKASEERFRTLVENAPVGIGLSTFSGRRALFRNKALSEMSGYTMEELVNTPIANRYADPKDWERLVQLVRKGPVRDFEVRMKHKNGSLYWASYTAIPQKTEYGDGYLSISQDITKRKLSEEALRASKEKFRNLFENSPVGIAIANVDGRSVERNTTLQKMLGYDSKEELMKTSAVDRYIDPEDRKRFLELLGKGPVRNFEVRFKRKDNTPLWVSMTAIPLKDEPEGKFITVTLDITERKQAEELFRTLAESSPVGTFIVQDGKLQYANRQFSYYTGYAVDEIKDGDFKSIAAPEDRDALKKQIDGVLTGGVVYLTPREYQFVNKAGEIRSAMLMVAPITYHQKDAVIGSYIDITDYKNMEKQVVEFKELNELKINLLSVVSHELRTPLATIKGYATLLSNYYDKLSDEEKKEHLATIDRATDRMGDLVEHLLEMSRLDAGLLVLNKTQTSLTKLLRETVGEARVRITTHDVSLTIDRRLPRANIDTSRIKQVVENLIDNASKYSEQGTRVELKAWRQKQEIVVSVTDHGRGIPPEELPRIFDRMYRIEKRLSPQFGGLGLGLSLCKGLVEAHGGRIWAESIPGKGSTFYFSLPLDKGKSKA